MDALARRGVVFEQAYTYWPKTRGSFVGIMTGRFASQTGYSKSHPLLLGFNPTLASVLKDAGYETVATVDNPNVAASLGYARGFDRYRETWEEKSLATEMDRTRAITGDGVRYLGEAKPDRPFLLWLHYVNPHAPYEPPAPWDTAFLDAEALARARPCARWTAFTAGSRGRGGSPARASAGTSRSTTARSPRWTPRSGSCSRRSTARRSATAPWS